MLINKSNVKKYALDLGSERHHKFTRVSKEFLIYIESRTKTIIREYIHSLPSVGKTIKVILITLTICINASAGEIWKITHYCPCKICCGSQAKGITASGKRAEPGMVAINWLPFGTKIKIDDTIYSVQDRGAKSLFGTKTNHIKHVDIFVRSHDEARRLGVKYSTVEILS